MCKHPYKGFQIGLTDNGKANLLRCSYKVDHVEKIRGRWEKVYDHFASPLSERTVRQYVELPCGQCIECRLNYSREWANRLMLEKVKYEEKDTWFITLTYDNDHLPECDSLIFPGTLVKSHLSDFMRALRDYRSYHYGIRDVRFYGCGEYGSHTQRPHYHVILFGIDLVELGLVNWEKSKTGYRQFRCPTLEKIWKKGMVVCGAVTWDSCAYTARYVLKKVNGPAADQYEKNGVIPEFVLMSRKPGIAKEYYDKYRDKIYEFDEIHLSNNKGGFKAKPPKYFDRLFEIECPETYESTKKKRKEFSESSRSLKLSHTDLPYLSILDAEEKILTDRLKLLVRNGDFIYEIEKGSREEKQG